MDILKKKFGKISGGRVLDVGTGRGWFIKLLKDNLKDYEEIIGIDIRDDVLEEARKKFDVPNIKFLNMSGIEMDFEDDSIDTVALSNSLHHLSEHEEIFKEMKRVLKPGGQIIIQEMFSDNQSEKQQSHVLVHHYQGELDTIQGICHNETYKRQEIIELIKNNGLEIIDVFEHNTHDEQKKEENLENEKEILDSIFAAMENHVEKIENHAKYEHYKSLLQELRSKLYDVGFFTATELIVVAKKKDRIN